MQGTFGSGSECESPKLLEEERITTEIRSTPTIGNTKELEERKNLRKNSRKKKRKEKNSNNKVAVSHAIETSQVTFNMLQKVKHPDEAKGRRAR